MRTWFARRRRKRLEYLVGKSIIDLAIFDRKPIGQVLGDVEREVEKIESETGEPFSFWLYDA